MEPDAIVEMIKGACADMRKEIEVLATQAEPAINHLNSVIGSLTEYRIEGSRPGGYNSADEPYVIYSEAPPRWWERLFGRITSVTEVEHHRKAEALEMAEKMFKNAQLTDENFTLDIQSIVDTPEKVGSMITDWLKIADEFSRNIVKRIPSDTTYIPTKGDMEGWLGSSAAEAYQATVRSQEEAASTASKLMRDLMKNCARFLESLTDTLANFAELANAQNIYWAERILGFVPTEVSFGQIKDFIEESVKLVYEAAELMTAEKKNFVISLNETISALLDIEELNSRIIEMGETASDDGWPGAATMTVIENDATPTERDLRYNAQYFHDHAAFWREISADLATLKSRSEAVTPIDRMFLRIPTFSADQSEALNNLSSDITTKVLAKGATTTADIATRLDDTIVAYLNTEAENTAIAHQIYKEIYGTEMP
ncbi:hypothetical protein HMPREF1531_01432 [Propionibacterium sp. oral taxon 192 str. F0372]|uniref:hypothetical protein n=1 Tax=Propionibacterium sp. oral taxon 192 TaxID=671222 RepID=UPI0003541FFC|nr:hypothetical protein [Propionibacterium sp. oral taxon 192]EPH03373.1 hypothetical protein HMPREF1531_01432 [Propionibacterium sp. oral taxon 192 str. F0372]